MALHQLIPRQHDGASQFPPGFLEQSRAPQIVAGNAVCQIVGTLFFFSRAYSRLILISAWKTEDCVLASAWLFATAYSICQYGQIEHGAGHHFAAIVMANPSDTVEAQKFAYVAQLVLFPALALSKLSICLSYMRIFYTDQGGHRMIQALVIVLVLSVVPFFFEVVFQCKPIHVYWTEGRPEEKCLRDLPALYVNGSMNVGVDAALIAIVLPRIMELHLNKRQRWALIGIVLLGSLAVTAGIVRMIRVGTTLMRADFDPTWDTYDVSIWTATEIYVSLICASAPGIKPLVSKLLPKLLGTTLRSRTRTTAAQQSIELGHRMKRTTIGSVSVHRGANELGIIIRDGPYMEISRGVDANSLDERSVVERADSAIFEVTEVTVEMGSAR